MPAFSWKQFRAIALETKIKRAKQMAQSESETPGTHPDFRISHPDWIKDIATPAKMVSDITKQVDKHQKVFVNRQRRKKGLPLLGANDAID